MRNPFSKRKQLDQESLQNTTKRIFDEIELRLTTDEEIYRFLTEELCGAAQGNSDALELIKNSNFFPIEYKSALDKKSVMDSEDSAQTFF